MAFREIQLSTFVFIHIPASLQNSSERPFVFIDILALFPEFWNRKCISRVDQLRAALRCHLTSFSHPTADIPAFSAPERLVVFVPVLYFHRHSRFVPRVLENSLVF